MNDSEVPGSLTMTVIRGVGLAGSGFVLSQTLTFAFYVALARLATPRDFGLFAAGSILAGAGMMFAESGMLAAVIQRKDRVEEAASTAVVATVVGGLFFSLIALVLSPVVGLFFQSHEVTLVAAALSGWVFLRSAMIVPGALMQRRFSFLRRVIVEPAGIIAFGVVAVIATANGMGVWGLVLGTYASAAVASVLSWALVRWWPKLRLASFQMWRELAGYGRHVLASEVVRRVGDVVPVALLGRFVGAAALGQFRYGVRIAMLPQMAVMEAGSYVLFPAFARIATEGERLRKAFVRTFRWMTMTTIPVGLALFPLSVPLAVLVFGERWREAGEAAMAMCAYPGARSVVSIAAETFKATGHPEILPRMHMLSACLAALLMLAMLPFGLLGIAAAVSLSSIGVAAYAIRGVHLVTEIPVRRMLSEIWPPAVAAIIMAGSVYGLELFVIDAESRGTALGLALLAAEAALVAAIYLAALAALAPRMARDFTGLTRVARDRLARRGQPGETTAETDSSETGTAIP